MDPPYIQAITGHYSPVIHYGSERWQIGLAPRRVDQHLPTYAVLGVTEGRHRISLGDQSWLLEPGQVAILTPDQQWQHQVARGAHLLYLVGTLTSATLIGPGENSVLRLDPKAGPQPQPQPLAIWGVDLPVVQPPSVSAAIYADLALGCDLWWRGDLSRLRANHHFAGIFLRAVIVAATGRGQQRVGKPDSVLERAMAVLAGRPPPRSASIWAAAVGLHRNRFAERFTEHFGEAPSDFLRQLRLRRAMELLEHSQENLDYIAHEAGYRDVAALGAAFRKTLGCSPSTWRQQRL